MGKNKLKKFAEMATFKNVVQPVPFDYNQPDHDLKGKWNNSFFHNDNPVVLELGCGKAEYTLALAKRYLDTNFIGVDIKGARMWKGAKDALSENIHNVGFLRTDITLIDKFFGMEEVRTIWLTFPDPQMQNYRRRLTATNFMEKYRKILIPDGVIHLKTDSNFQYRYTMEMARENNFNIIASTDNLYGSELLNEDLSVRTFYEKQWSERGINIKYMAFQLNRNEPLHEPSVEIERDQYRSFGRSARH